MREQVVGGFSAQLRDIFREAKESYSNTKARVEEVIADAQRHADSGHGNGQRFLFSEDVVDMGASPPLVKRAFQTLGSLFATGFLIGGLACLGLALVQLMAAFFVMTQMLGIRIDFDPAQVAT